MAHFVTDVRMLRGTNRLHPAFLERTLPAAMPFAIVDIAGTQEKVTPGLRLRVPVLRGKREGDTVTFDRVLLLSGDGRETQVGSPYVEGATVEGKVQGVGRGGKVRVFKMKHRKRYRRTQGHRQGFTEIEVTNITA